MELDSPAWTIYGVITKLWAYGSLSDSFYSHNALSILSSLPSVVAGYWNSNTGRLSVAPGEALYLLRSKVHLVQKEQAAPE